MSETRRASPRARAKGCDLGLPAQTLPLYGDYSGLNLVNSTEIKKKWEQRDLHCTCLREDSSFKY